MQTTNVLLSGQGSYQFDQLDDHIQTQEFNRLAYQAKLLAPIEKNIWHQLELSPGQRILDLGCGPGIITHALADYVYPGEVVGIDKSQELISSLKKQGSQTNITFCCGDIYDLAFEQQFDIVYARLLFQHLTDPLKALETIRKLLKPGGKVCILDVDDDWASVYPEPESFARLRQKVTQRQQVLGGDPWVGRKLASYAHKAGFTPVETMIQLIDSNRLGLDNFFELLSLGAHYRSQKQDFDELGIVHQDIQNLIKNSPAWAGFGLFVVVGHKPKT